MSTTKPNPRAPTLADLDALPPGVVGEIIEGVLYTMTKPRIRHQRTTRVIGGRIGDRFDDGIDGPGGWWIVTEPGIELPNTPEISPDVAGWRRGHPELPVDEPIRRARLGLRDPRQRRGAMTCLQTALCQDRRTVHGSSISMRVLTRTSSW
jgi:hypothetical protein